MHIQYNRNIFDIVGNLESPCEWITWSIKDASKAITKCLKREYPLWHSRYIECPYIICYVVLSNDKLVILTLHMVLFVLSIFPQGYISIE